MTDTRRYMGGMSPDRPQSQMAVIKFDPSEQLKRLLFELMNEDAVRARGAKALDIALHMRPFVFNDANRSDHALVVEEGHRLESIRPDRVRVTKRWNYSTDANREHGATFLRIAMGVGATAAAEAIRQSPLRSAKDPFQLSAEVTLQRSDLKDTAAEIEAARRRIAEIIAEDTKAEEYYAPSGYYLDRPHVVKIPNPGLRVLPGNASD